MTKFSDIKDKLPIINKRALEATLKDFENFAIEIIQKERNLPRDVIERDYLSTSFTKNTKRLIEASINISGEPVPLERFIEGVNTPLQYEVIRGSKRIGRRMFLKRSKRGIREVFGSGWFNPKGTIVKRVPGIANLFKRKRIIKQIVTRANEVFNEEYKKAFKEELRGIT